MELFIKLSNNKPVDHPITRENMTSAYPHIDPDNLPADWAKFERVLQPKIGPYEVTECFYEWDGDVVKDVWYIYPMSNEEKKAKQERVKKSWVEDGGFSNWIFDEANCTHVPPVPMPGDGKPYIWVQEAQSWVAVKIESPSADIQPVPYPLDGKEYEFDQTSNSWVPKS